MGKASPILTSFNAGELSPRLEGRSDLGKYPNGCKILENYIPAIQGPAVRRGGTMYVNEVKQSANKTWLVKFEFNTVQAYVLEFGDFYIRFYANHGQAIISAPAAYSGVTAYVIGDLVSSGGINYYCKKATTGNAPPNATYWYPLTGVIYEIPSPYAVADLTNADGAFALSYVQSGDIIYFAHALYPQQKLSRFGSTKWTMAPVAFTGGPFKDEDPNATITLYASANTGSVTLTASAASFQAGHVGALVYLGEKDVRSIVQWEAGKAYAINALVRSGNCNYRAINAATSGGIKPIHTSGAVYDGTTGVQWQFLDPGYGYAQITAYTSPTVVTATVIERLPDNAVLVANATTHWRLGRWNSVDGYPSVVTFFRERLVWGTTRYLNMSVSGDYENHHSKDDGGNIAADMAVSIQIVSRQVNNIIWMDPSQDLLIGTSGGEFICRELTKNQVFGPENVTIVPQSENGSRGIRPSRVGFSLVYVGRSGRKVREMAYDFGPDNYKSTDVTILSEHIATSGLIDSSLQLEPYSIIWYVRADGVLAAFTFNREQDVVGWHRHILGGSGSVESVVCIPSPDNSRMEVWMTVKRTINGATKRYVEYMTAEHAVGDDPELAFYVDAGLTYDGKVNATLTPGAGAGVNHNTNVPFTSGSAVFSAGDVGREIHYRYATTTIDASGNSVQSFATAKALITTFTDSSNVSCTINAAFPSLAAIAANAWRMTVTTISGLTHLEGATVDLLVNGATHPQLVVTGGSITLQNPGSLVNVGLACPARLQTMRLNMGAQDGTSQGKTARVNKVTVRLLDTLGLKFGASFSNMYEINSRTALNDMDNVPPLYTGDIILDWPGDYDTNPWLCFENDQPLPSMIIGIMPQITVQDR